MMCFDLHSRPSHGQFRCDRASEISGGAHDVGYTVRGPNSECQVEGKTRRYSDCCAFVDSRLASCPRIGKYNFYRLANAAGTASQDRPVGSEPKAATRASGAVGGGFGGV